MNLDDYNIHVIASVFKQWLRDLPNPLMTFELYEEFLRAMGEEPPSLSPSLGRGKCWPLVVANFLFTLQAEIRWFCQNLVSKSVFLAIRVF